jgi:RecG-like helicase
MARCKDIKSATYIYDNYYNTEELEEYNPILIHSKISSYQKQKLLSQLKNKESKIVVCVDML